MKELLPGLLAVTEIMAARDIHIDNKLAPGKLLYKEIGLDIDEWTYEVIPEGYTIIGIGTADKITEQEIKKVFGQEWTEGSLKVFLNLNNLNPSTTILLISKKYIYGK